MTEVTESHDRYTARLKAFRADQRSTTNAGVVTCLIGLLLMVSGQYVAEFPRWAPYAGFAVIVFGWGLFTLSIFKAVAFRRANPPIPEVRS